MTALAAVAAAVTTWLALRPLVGIERQPRRPPGHAAAWWGLAGAGAWFAVGPVALVVVAVVAATRVLLAVRVRRREAATTARRVLEACEQIAADLATGQSPALALAAAARAWPALAPVAEAGALGGDVPGGLRRLAATPGAGDLRLVAAAWVVSHRTGAGLAASLERVASTIRSDRATARVVEGELASARATARLVAALPVLVWLLGAGGGGAPWEFLLDTAPGLACLVGGLSLGFLGLWWIERIADGVSA